MDGLGRIIATKEDLAGLEQKIQEKYITKDELPEIVEKLLMKALTELMKKK